MPKTALVITSIATDNHPVLQQYAEQSTQHGIEFIVVGDTKSPADFNLPGCNFFSVKRQQSLEFSLVNVLPYQHYARKNLGYLAAIKNGAKIIIETDDDNIPFAEFWLPRQKVRLARIAKNTAWTNVYGYFSKKPIWPRGFALDKILDPLPNLTAPQNVICPVQQGLADDNPDVDAIYRLTQPLPIQFDRAENIGLQTHSICPFNSQNTTWFAEAFPLLYLPSFCSFRMTDIWRSFVAQRIMWSCEWTLLFHNSTVRQDRNDHNLMADFEEEIAGYKNNYHIVEALADLRLNQSTDAVGSNLFACYERLVEKNFMNHKELGLVSAWLKDLADLK